MPRTLLNGCVPWRITSTESASRSRLTPWTRSPSRSYWRLFGSARSRRRSRTRRLALEGSDASVKPITLDDPDDWQAGFLSTIEGVAVVGPYHGPAPSIEAVEAPSDSVDKTKSAEPIEYWVCEVASGELVAGDKVVVTPLPGIEAEGDEPIRVRKSQLK